MTLAALCVPPTNATNDDDVHFSALRGAVGRWQQAPLTLPVNAFGLWGTLRDTGALLCINGRLDLTHFELRRRAHNSAEHQQKQQQQHQQQQHDNDSLFDEVGNDQDAVDDNKDADDDEGEVGDDDDDASKINDNENNNDANKPVVADERDWFVDNALRVLAMAVNCDRDDNNDDADETSNVNNMSGNWTLMQAVSKDSPSSTSFTMSLHALVVGSDSSSDRCRRIVSNDIVVLIVVVVASLGAHGQIALNNVCNALQHAMT